MIKTELLSEKNFKTDSLDDYSRKQAVKRVYRKHDGEYVLVDCPYTEDWDLKKKRSVTKSISRNDYNTYLAIDNDKAVGVIGLKKALVNSHMILDMLQVSSEYRGHGIGRRLFDIGKV